MRNSLSNIFDILLRLEVGLQLEGSEGSSDVSLKGEGE